MEVQLADSLHGRLLQLVVVKHGMMPDKDGSLEVAVLPDDNALHLQECYP